MSGILVGYRLLGGMLELVAEHGTLGERSDFLRVMASRLEEAQVELLVQVCELAQADPHNVTHWIEAEGLRGAGDEPLEEAA